MYFLTLLLLLCLPMLSLANTADVIQQPDSGGANTVNAFSPVTVLGDWTSTDAVVISSTSATGGAGISYLEAGGGSFTAKVKGGNSGWKIRDVTAGADRFDIRGDGSIRMGIRTNWIPSSNCCAQPSWVLDNGYVQGIAAAGYEFGVSGVSSASGSGHNAPGGVAAGGSADVAGSSAWGVYIETVLFPTATEIWGIEIDVNNRSGVSGVYTPYGGTLNSIGIQISGDGTDIGGVALIVSPNPTGFNSGIIFTDTALTRNSGLANAIEFANAQMLHWYASNGSAASRFYYQDSVATNAPDVILSHGVMTVAFTTPSTATFWAQAGIKQNACTTAGTLSADTSGDIICTVSSARYKHDVAPLHEGLALVNALHPVTFHYNDDMHMGPQKHAGFTAEDVYTIAPELVALNAEGQPEGVHYQEYTAVLTRAIQELTARLERLEGTRQ